MEEAEGTQEMQEEEKLDRPPLEPVIWVEVVKKVADDGEESRSSNILAILTVRDAGQP